MTVDDVTTLIGACAGLLTALAALVTAVKRPRKE